MSPAAGEIWRNGTTRTLLWHSEQLARGTAAWIVLERGLMMGVETDCIARNYPWDSGTFGTYLLHVGNYACVDGSAPATLRLRLDQHLVLIVAEPWLKAPMSSWFQSRTRQRAPVRRCDRERIGLFPIPRIKKLR